MISQTLCCAPLPQGLLIVPPTQRQKSQGLMWQITDITLFLLPKRWKWGMHVFIPVVNYLLLKVIVPAAQMKSVANMLRLSPRSQALWGLLCLPLISLSYTVTMNRWLPGRKTASFGMSCWEESHVEKNQAVIGVTSVHHKWSCFIVEVQQDIGMQWYWFTAWQYCPSVAAEENHFLLMGWGGNETDRGNDKQTDRGEQIHLPRIDPYLPTITYCSLATVGNE